MAITVLRDPAPRTVVPHSPTDTEVVTTAPPSKIGPGGPAGPPAWAPPVGWTMVGEYVKGPPASTVLWQGSTYVALVDNVGVQPDLNPATWQLVAAGGSSAARLSYQQDYAIADTVWVAEHNLGFVPAGIQVFDQTGRPRFGFAVTSNTAESTTVEYAFPLIGRIILS